MSIQVRLPPALAAVHNFIRKHDPQDLDSDENIEDPQPGLRAAGEGQLSAGIPRAAERRQANAIRDGIARDMWEQYRAECARRNQG
jgi:hypothetical protein